MKVIGIIPSRLASTRLPNKALVDIEGLPMIVHVFKRAQMAKSLDEVIVATDSQEIMDEVKRLGGKAVMTSAAHQTGTDRVAEVAKGVEADIIVNIQGDEALLDPSHIDLAVKALAEDPDVQVSVLVTPYKKRGSFSDIKAVIDKDSNVMYCTRNDVPSEIFNHVDHLWKMCFLVPMRREFLFTFASWPQSPLESVESIEHLRILENGYKMRAVPVGHAHISVDTPDDLAEVRKLMRLDTLQNSYLNDCPSGKSQL